jgi:predicted dehydrogenase
MSNIKVGVVGVGALGRHHARILSKMEGVDLVGVVDPSPQNGEAVAQACGCPWFTSHTELFDRCDAVSIVVPTSLHQPISREFLSQGIDVLVEKPLTANVSTAEDIVDLAQKQGRILQVGHVERFNSAYQAVKSTISSSPRYIRAERLAPFTFRSTDISVVFDLMIHDIDLCLDMTRSPVVTVKSFGFALMGKLLDTVQTRLWFANGAIADLTASRVNPEPRRTLQVWTAAECIEANLHERQVRCYAPTEELINGPLPVEMAKQPGANVSELKDSVFGRFINTTQVDVPTVDALTAELQEFVDCVRERNKPDVDGYAALQAVTIAATVEESVSHHNWSGWGLQSNTAKRRAA